MRRHTRTIRPSHALIALLLACLAALALSACTISRGIVKDVQVKPDKTLTIERCDLVAYGVFGIVEEQNCHVETRK